jgi:glycosyltransferase involved in cell wall biosynthesis
MKILHLVYDHMGNPWLGGGGAVRVHELNRRLADKGHEVTMLCGRYPGAGDCQEGGLSVRFAGLSSGYLLSTLSYAAAASAFVFRHGRLYDVLVEDLTPWNPSFPALMTRTPVVGHMNHSEGPNILRRYPLIGILFYLLDRYYHRLFRRLTALSEGTRRRIRRPDAHLLPAGIGNDALLGSREGGMMEDGGYLLYVGRMEINNKGLDTLAQDLREGGGHRLVVAGRGREERKFREMVSGLDVDFKGFVSEQEKKELLRRCSALVLPSRFEGWGIVVLEAAACGKPVIVSDIIELDYAVGGGFGLSFAKGDSLDLASVMDRVMGEPALRDELGKRAREFARRYTWDSIAEDYERYLLHVVRDSGAG